MATTTRTVHGIGRPQIYVTEESLKRKSTGATTYTLTTVAEAGADFETDPKTKDANLVYVTWGTGNDAKTSNGKITAVSAGTYTVDKWDGDGQPTNGKEFFSYKMRYVASDATTYTTTGVTETGTDFTVVSEIIVGAMVHATWTVADASGRLTKQGRARITEIVSATELKMADGWEADGQPPDGIRFWIEDINIELPVPQNDGEIERYQPERIVHKLGTGRLLKENKGYRATFELDYSNKVVGDTLLDLRTLLNEFEHGDLFFKPRSDDARSFNVFLTEDEIQLGLIGPAQGHKGLILRFESTELTDGVISKLTGWCIDYATWTND